MQPPPSTEKIRILIVEDDSVDAKAITRALTAKDPSLQLEVATSVTRARAKLAEGSYAAVIIDYELGDGTGLDLLAAIGDTPAIMLTGSGSVRVAARALRLRVSDYLIKDAYRNYLKKLPEVLTSALAERARLIGERGEKLARLDALLADVLDQAAASLEAIPETSAARARVEQVVESSKRAAELCQQLIALNVAPRGEPADPARDP
jgi:DNA-binding NtrC family response regulator